MADDVSSKDVSRLLTAIANQSTIIMELIDQNRLLINTLLDDEDEDEGKAVYLSGES